MCAIDLSVIAGLQCANIRSRGATMAVRRRVKCLIAGLASSAALATLGVTPAAWANPVGSDTTYSGSGQQHAAWNVGDKRLRMWVSPSSQMLTTRCMDAQLDWDVPPGMHYDLREIRSCRPGAQNFTDPSGNGWWGEPSDFAGTDMQRGFGLSISDDASDPDGTIFPVFEQQRFVGSGNVALVEVPRTTDCFARTNTLYQDGHHDWTDNFGKPYTQSECAS